MRIQKKTNWQNTYYELILHASAPTKCNSVKDTCMFISKSYLWVFPVCRNNNIAMFQ